MTIQAVLSVAPGSAECRSGVVVSLVVVAPYSIQIRQFQAYRCRASCINSILDAEQFTRNPFDPTSGSFAPQKASLSHLREIYRKPVKYQSRRTGVKEYEYQDRKNQGCSVS